MVSNQSFEIKQPYTYIALLRGINVGGKNKLPMKDLTSLFEEAGCTNVQTYIQSGNVIFESYPDLVQMIPAIVRQSIQQSFSYDIPVITRSALNLKQIIQGNPFLQPGADEKELHVVYLADSPQHAAVASLDPNRSPPDEVAVFGREIYLRCPNGLARTRFTNAYFDATLSTTSTMRNWRTTLKLLELARAA